MKIAIGLPNALPRTAGPGLVAFAREAEAAGFSSLGTIGRIVYDSHEELIALAACAGATSRIGLATTVLISPARETVLLAKQAATLHAISGGRLTLGLGVGWRDDDFRALGTKAQYEERGSVIVRQVETLRRVWSGGPVADGIGAVGPTLAKGAGPGILLGGATEAPLRRAGRLADGFLASPGPAATIAAHYAVVKSAWQEAGRPGAPRLVAPRYFVLGDDARATAEANVRAYYAVGGDAAVQGVLSGLVTDTDGVRRAVAELEAIGVDEAFFWPMNADLRQIERLAKALR
jgi:alkanesulfonate monooxygenase SsuD/methylene tetrahydromethanopterin reductase-like flavin-dependent oxidoreductase (luciferase family)